MAKAELPTRGGPRPIDWTDEEYREFLECGYISFKSEAEVEAWCEALTAESWADIDVEEEANRAATAP